LPTTAKVFLIIGAVNAFLAVLLGAFGAHALKARIPAELLASYHTGNQYHLYHALGLLLIGLIANHLPDSSLLKWSGWLMFCGIVFFSGSLYVLGVSGIRGFGAVTPFGGIMFILAWVLLAVAVWKA
jgi:uncharacterized membrane protein YgdD (TMEM256/DUF423 family)